MSSVPVTGAFRRFSLPVRVKAVVIDLDGTLLDTVGDLASAANAMRTELGLPPVEAEILKSYVGKGIVNLVARAMTGGAGWLEEDKLNAAVAVFERHYAACLATTTRPFPGVIEGLKALRDKGLHLGCITNKLARFTEPLLETLGLTGHFEIVLSGDSLPRKKPDPLPLQHAAKYFGIGEHELLLIGDSLNDVQAARSAGSPVFIVPYGYNEGRDVRTLDCDALVAGLDEAAKWVENGGKLN
jgi:phosphoglycolate phosphatase